MKRLSLLPAMTLIMALNVMSSSAAAQNYEGTLRVYMVEPESRWINMWSGEPIRQAMIDFALVEALDIPLGSTVTLDTLWDASVCSGLNNVSQDNIEAVGAVFASEWVWADSYPPYAYWFELHEGEASAAATPGVSGANVAQGGMTHSVFCEEATATWCANCPIVSANLHAAKMALGASMNYVALVEDMSAVAEARLTELNPVGYPTTYFDGGLAIQVNDTALATMETNIATVGADSVADIGLVLRLDHVQSDQFMVVARVSHGIPANVPPTNPDAPVCADSGAPGVAFEISVVADDADGDDVYYLVDWGDGITPGFWQGPFPSGAPIILTNIYQTMDAYGISVMAKDVWGAETAWSPAAVITIGPSCCRYVGDINHSGVDGDPGSGAWDIADLIYLVLYMFQGGPCDSMCNDGIDCSHEHAILPEADFNCDGKDQPDIADLIYMVSSAFGNGPSSPCWEDGVTPACNRP